MVHEVIDACLRELRDGTLTEPKLKHAFEKVAGGRQRATGSALPADPEQLAGLPGSRDGVVRDGDILEGPPNPNDWPYQSPLDAIRDGWRVIRFPDMALMMDESRTYGLGFEFILERWG